MSIHFMSWISYTCPEICQNTRKLWQQSEQCICRSLLEYMYTRQKAAKWVHWGIGCICDPEQIFFYLFIVWWWRRGIIVRTKYCRSLGCEGSYPSVWLLHKSSHNKRFNNAVKHAHSEYAIFLENQHKQALFEEEKKKKEQAEEAKRVEQRTSKRLHEQLAEQAQLETVQMAEQETARQLIFGSLKEVVWSSPRNREQSIRCKGCTGYTKCGQREVECQ